MLEVQEKSRNSRLGIAFGTNADRGRVQCRDGHAETRDVVLKGKQLGLNLIVEAISQRRVDVLVLIVSNSMEA